MLGRGGSDIKVTEGEQGIELGLDSNLALPLTI